jgi:hypothetical protein
MMILFSQFWTECCMIGNVYQSEIPDSKTVVLSRLSTLKKRETG